ncbi:MAG TPA: entericidin A/B family lipoprotein [Rhodocyclaceae bacterium]|nr:entericidin A/B family lipoprotein [Rhodocyclaceae bacterium]
MKKIVSVFFAIAAIVSLSACNTVQGIGKDIEKGGEALQRASNK